MKRIAFTVLLASVPLTGAAQLELSLAEPEWVLDPVGPPLGQREALLPAGPLALEVTRAVGDGDYAEAIRLFERQGYMDDPEAMRYAVDPAILLLMGQIYTLVENYESAEVVLTVALAALPDFVRAHQALGLLYLLQDRLEDAYRHLARAVALGGANADLLGYLGYVNRELNNHWGSISAYQQALMLEYENPEWQKGLLFGLIQVRQYGSARTFVEQLLNEHADDAELWLYRAQAALQSEDHETALTSLEVAIRLGELDSNNLHVGALLHLEIGSTPRAIELLRASLAEGLEYTYVDQTLAWLLDEGQLDFAAELIEAAEQEAAALDDVDRSGLLGRKGSLAMRQDRNADAIEHLTEAVALDPANSTALLGLADVYAEEQEFVRAGLLYERASAFDDVRERALLSHAQMALERRDYVPALELLRAASRENPNRYDLLQNIEILENVLSARQE